MRRPSTYAVALGSALVASHLGAGVVHYAPSGSDFERRKLDVACVEAGSAGCEKALEEAVPKAAAQLVRLAERRHPRAAELARRAADSALPELRIAAAQAFSQLSVEASYTAELGELLDDPVSAVRAEALRALYGSMDERGRSLAQRADAFGSSGNQPGLGADSVPATAGLGVQLPADAFFLHFGSNVSAGRYAFVTGEAPAALVARLKKAGSGPFQPEQWYDMLLSLKEPSDDEEAESDDEEAESDDESDSGMPSAADMAKAMEMMGKMNQAMNEHPDAKTPEQQARVMSKALSGQRHVDYGLGDSYGEKALFGDPQLFLLELSDGSDVGVVVYQDKLLQRTGIAVHRTP